MSITRSIQGKISIIIIISNRAIKKVTLIKNFLPQLQINLMIYIRDRVNLACNTTSSKQIARKRIDYGNKLLYIKITLDNSKSTTNCDKYKK
jgi:hypothetical protein